MSVQTNIKGASGYSVEVDDSNRLLVASSVLDGYHIAEQGLAAENPKYFGYTDEDENWYIQRMNRTTGTARYASGSGDFPTAYANKKSQIYNYFYVEF